MPFKIDELFYELDARTAGFEDKILHSQRTVGDFAKFITEKPMFALAALGAAMVAVAAEATKMAADIDKSLRQVSAAAPEATAHMGQLRDVIAALSEITPRSQAELAQAAEKIAHTGADSITEVVSRLRIATTVADATGTDLETIIEGLSAITKSFGLQGQAAADAITRLFGATQGRVELEESFNVFRRSGAVLKSLGVTAGDAADALAALLRTGIIPRQAGSLLSQITDLEGKVKGLRSGTEDQAKAAAIIETTLSRAHIQAVGFTQAIGDLAKQMLDAGVDVDSLGIRHQELAAIQNIGASAARDNRTETEKLEDANKRLAAAAETNRGSAEALSKFLKNELTESLVNLGNKILPFAIKALDGLTDAMRRLRGEGNPLKELDILAGGKLPSVGRLPGITLGQLKANSYTPNEVLGALGDRGLGELIAGPSKESRAADAFYQALDDLATRSKKYGADAFSGVPPEKLQQIAETLKKFIALHPEEIGGQAGQRGENIDLLTVVLNKAISDASADTSGGNAPPGKPGVDHLTEQVRDAIRALRNGIETSIASETQTKIDDARIRVANFRAEVDKLERKAGRSLPDLEAEVRRIEALPGEIEKKERRDISRSVADEAAKALGIQSVAMQQALDDFNERAKVANAEAAKLHIQPFFSAEQIKSINDIRTALIDAQRETEATTALLLDLQVKEAQRRPLTKLSTPADRRNEVADNVLEQLDLSDRLRSRQAALGALGNAQDPASVAKRKILLEEIARIQAKINELAGKNAQIENEENAAILRRISLLEQTAEAITAATGLASELASAFGGSGQAIGNIISKIGGIASAVSSVKPFLAALDVFKSGKKDDAGNALVSLGSLLGKASPIIAGVSAGIGLVGSLFGKDPAVAQAQAETATAMKSLTSALLALRDSYIQNVSTADSQKDLAIISKALGLIGTGQFGGVTFNGKRVLQDGEGNGPGRRGNLRDIGAALGKDFDSGDLLKYLQDVDKRYGTNLASFVEREAPQGLLDALQKVPDALKGELQNLGKYANNAAGVIDRVNYQFAVLGKTNAVEKFKAIIDALTASGQDLGDFADTFKTLNAPDSTAEQRQKAIDDALQKLTTGSGINFGTLTAEQIRQLLQQGADALRTQNPGTGGFNVNQQITEARGERIDALLSTGNIYLSHIDESTALIASILGGARPAGILPPSFPSDIGSGGTITVEMNINVQGVVGDPQVVGTQIGQSAAEQFNKSLGRRTKWRAVAAGKTLSA